MNKEHQPKYEILKAHRRTDGSYKSLEVLEMEYIELTDKLIHRMTDGVEFTDHDGERIKAAPTTVIFLDKSARPVAWLTRELWDTLAPEPGSEEIPEQPAFKFLNIDRKRLRNKLDPNKTGAFDASFFTAHEIEGLRSIFNRDHDGSSDAPNDLDNQRILIVDEVQATGATMQMAQGLLKRAFPTSLVQGTYWMGKEATLSNGAKGNADLPIWYNEHLETGRGVADAPQNITDPSQLFLSRRFPAADEKSLLLRQDFKTLAASLGKSALYIPKHRPDESAELRSLHINQKDYYEVMQDRRELLNKHKDK